MCLVGKWEYILLSNFERIGHLGKTIHTVEYSASQTRATNTNQHSSGQEQIQRCPTYRYPYKYELYCQRMCHLGNYHTLARIILSNLMHTCQLDRKQYKGYSDSLHMIVLSQCTTARTCDQKSLPNIPNLMHWGNSTHKYDLHRMQIWESGRFAHIDCHEYQQKASDSLGTESHISQNMGQQIRLNKLLHTIEYCSCRNGQEDI